MSVGLTSALSSGRLLGSAIADLTSKGAIMPVSNESKQLVQAFFSAMSVFIRGTWTATRGATIDRTDKTGKVRNDKVFDIMVANGQVNGAPEIDTVALVTKAKGEVAMYVLTEQVGQGVTTQGIGYTLWSGTLVKQ